MAKKQSIFTSAAGLILVLGWELHYCLGSSLLARRPEGESISTITLGKGSIEIENVGSGVFTDEPDTVTDETVTNNRSSRSSPKQQQQQQQQQGLLSYQNESTTTTSSPQNSTTQNSTCSSNRNSRRENKVMSIEDLCDDLATWEAPEFIQKQYPYYLAGYDDDDRPIWMGEIGKFNFRKLVEEGGVTLKAFDIYVQQAAYRVIKSMEAKGVSEAVYLLDMDGLEFFQLAHVPTVSYVLKLARSYRDLAVTHLGGGIIINANYFAETFINILRPIFSRAFERVEIFGTNKAKWLPKVLRKYPREALPPWYGGYPTFTPIKVYG